MRRLIAVLPIAALLVLVGIFVAFVIGHHDPQISPRALVGRPAPDVSLPTLDGGPKAPLKGALHGPTLVNFFASWCAPCAEEAPALMALKAEGVQIIGVAWEDDPDKTRAFLQRFGNPYSVIFVDRDGRAGIDFGVSGVPETYLISATGQILDKRALPLTAADAEALLRAADASR